MRSRFFLFALLLFAFGLGWAGIDFGYHWDEIKLIRSVRATYREGRLLPGWYNYPSVSYTLALVSSLPQAWQVIKQEGSPQTLDPLAFLRVAQELYRPINARLEPPQFAPQMRPLFLFITLLSGVWVYLLGRDLWKNRWVGLLACALLLASWEFAYHARWGAPDGLLTSFGLLAVWLALRGWQENRLGWLLLSAAAAGLAAGSKYYGGLFLLPAAAALLKRGPFSGSTWWRLAGLGLVFASVFLLTTPGLLLEPAAVWRDVQTEIHHYATYHFGQTVEAGPQHWSLLLGWLAWQGFSPFAPLAALIFGLGLWGAWQTRRLPGLEIALVFGLPLLMGFYLGLQRVLIVRNDLALLPFFALLAAGGTQALWNKMKPPRRWWLLALILTGLALNFGWQGYAVQTIRQRQTLSAAACLQDYVRRHQQTRIFLSPAARSLAGNFSAPNLAQTREGAEIFLYLSGEIKHPLTSNRPFFYETPCGPYEVNFNFYPDWEGDTRLVAARMENMLYERLTREK